MTKNWQIKTLGEVCDKASSSVSQNQLTNEDGNYPIYGASGFIKNVSFYHQDKAYVSIVKDGAGIGRIALLPASSSVIGTLQYLIPKETLNIRYFYYFLNGIDFWKYKNGSTIPHIYFKDYAVEPILVPPLPEQKRLVKVLDKVFEKTAKARENTEKNLQNARELFESYLQSVDAKKESLGSLVNITTGKLDVNAAKENGRYPFFTCAREIYAIDEYAFDCEAILLAGNNAVGDFNVKHYKGKFNAYQRTYVITVNDENRVLYRYLYFQMLKSLKEFKQKSVGVGTKFLKLGMIKEMRIALPSIKEQVSIVVKLDSISSETKKLEAIYQQKLADLEELKKSILQKAFNGKLVGACS